MIFHRRVVPLLTRSLGGHADKSREYLFFPEQGGTVLFLSYL